MNNQTQTDVQVIEKYLKLIPPECGDLQAFVANLQDFLNHASILNYSAPNCPYYHLLTTIVTHYLTPASYPMGLITVFEFLDEFIMSLSPLYLSDPLPTIMFGSVVLKLNSLPFPVPMRLNQTVNRLKELAFKLVLGQPENYRFPMITGLEAMALLPNLGLDNLDLVHPILHDLIKMIQTHPARLATILFYSDRNYPQIPEYHQKNLDLLSELLAQPDLYLEMKQLVTAGALPNPETGLTHLFAHDSTHSQLIDHFTTLSGLVGVDGKSWLVSAIGKKAKLICSKIKQVPLTYDAVEDPTNPYKDPNFVKFPKNLKFWVCAIDLADQIYHLVATEAVSYSAILDEFYKLVVNESDPYDYPSKRIEIMPKDNLLIWFILQLFHLESLKSEIGSDFQGPEQQFSKIIALYQPEQALSSSGFYLRDLALSCAMVHQQEVMVDRVNLKSRFPELQPALRFAATVFNMSLFHQDIKDKVNSHTLFLDMDDLTLQKLILAGQARQAILSSILYINLVPKMTEPLNLLSQNCVYLNGGVIHPNVIWLLPVNDKVGLLGLILSMGLTMNGPRAPIKLEKEPNCPSPATVETVAMLVYGAQWSSGSLFKSILDNLREIDFLAKPMASDILVKRKDMLSQNLYSGEDELMALTRSTMMPQSTLFYQYITLQLLNFHMLPYLYQCQFNDINLLSLVHNTLIGQNHPQLYTQGELFTLNVIDLSDGKHLLNMINEIDTGMDSLFPGQTLLSRVILYQLAVDIKLGHIELKHQQELLKAVHKVTEYQQMFSTETLTHFPAEMSTTLLLVSEAALPFIPPMSIDGTKLFISSLDLYHKALYPGQNDEGIVNGVDALSSLENLYLAPTNSPHFLIMIYLISQTLPSLTSRLKKLLFGVMTKIDPSLHYDLCFQFINAILNQPDFNPLPFANLLLDWVFQYRILNLHHVIFALACHQLPDMTSELDQLVGLEPKPSVTELGFKVLEHILLNDQFKQRYKQNEELGLFPPIHHHNKPFQYARQFQNHSNYHSQFKEYYQFESLDEIIPKLPTLPNYYVNDILNILPIIRYMIHGMIEHGQIQLLVNIFNTYPLLLKCQPNSLKLMSDILYYYYYLNLEILLNWDTDKKYLDLIRLMVKMVDNNYTKIFNQWLINDTEVEFNLSYFEQLILSIKTELDLSCHNDQSVVSETIDVKLKLVQIELLSINLTLQHIVSSLITANDGLISKYANPTQFYHITGLILASLPTQFTNELINQFSKSPNSSLLNILSSTLHFSPSDRMIGLTSIYHSFNPNNIDQLIQLYQIIVPSLYKIINNIPCLDTLLTGLITKTVQLIQFEKADQENWDIITITLHHIKKRYTLPIIKANYNEDAMIDTFPLPNLLNLVVSLTIKKEPLEKRIKYELPIEILPNDIDFKGVEQVLLAIEKLIIS